ncbi:MAG: prolyl oligopeptidase family serine peptidase [Chitinophagaceae bacterium]
MNSYLNKNFIKQIILLFILSLSDSLYAQDKADYLKHWFIQNGDTMPYRILFPVDYDSNKNYPVIFFLHGRGESGNDNEKQLTHGANLFLRDSIRKNYPAIVVFPQCSSGSYWSNVHTIAEGSSRGKRSFYFVNDGPPSQAMCLLLSLVDHVLTRYKIDINRIYAGGLSMGGMGTFELVRRMPKTFAAAFAICGGAHPATAKQIRKTSWWLFHGLKDDVVLPEYTQQMEAALKKEKADIRVTYYPQANHNSWDPAFAEPDLLSWLFSKRR